MSTTATKDRLITDREVGAIYGVSRQCIWRWAEKDKIPKPVVQRPKYSRWSENQVLENVAGIVNAEKAEAAS